MSVVSIQPKGTTFTRYAMCLGIARGGLVEASKLGDGTFGTGSNVASLLRAGASIGSPDFTAWPSEIKSLIDSERNRAVDDLRERHVRGEISTEMYYKSATDAGTTASANWAHPLAEARVAQADFMEAVATRSILGRLTALRKVPPNMTLPRQATRIISGWVGEGRPYPVAPLSTDTIQLGASGIPKIGTIVPMTVDLLNFSDSRAEMLVRRDLVNAAAAMGDQGFLDPSEAGQAGIQPASITHALVPLSSSGSVMTDLEELINAYQGDLDSACFVTDKLTATQIGLRSSGSNSVVVGARGGDAVGIPVLVSDGLPRSSSGGRILLFDQAQTCIADQGVAVDVTSSAAIQMVDNPNTGATSLRSLWQNNLVAFRLSRLLDWAAPADGCAVLLDGAVY